MLRVGSSGSIAERLRTLAGVPGMSLVGFGVPYFITFFLEGTIMKSKSILLSPWPLKSPV